MNAGHEAVMLRWLMSRQKLRLRPSVTISRPPSRTTRALAVRSFWFLSMFSASSEQARAFHRPRHHVIVAPIQSSFSRSDKRLETMANAREPMLQPVPILTLRPTQMTVGMREVKEKRKRWREHKDKKKQAELLGKHMIPVVHGPDNHYYVVDHHHLARALHDEGVKDILVTIIGNLSMVDRDAFWGVMDNKRWVYPYDSKGERRRFKD